MPSSRFRAMSGVNSVVSVFQNLFSNHGSTFLNVILVVTTIGGQSVGNSCTRYSHGERGDDVVDVNSNNAVEEEMNKLNYSVLL